MRESLYFLLVPHLEALELPGIVGTSKLAEASRRIVYNATIADAHAHAVVGIYYIHRASTVCYKLDYTKRNFPDFKMSRMSVE